MKQAVLRSQPAILDVLKYHYPDADAEQSGRGLPRAAGPYAARLACHVNAAMLVRCPAPAQASSTGHPGPIQHWWEVSEDVPQGLLRQLEPPLSKLRWSFESKHYCNMEHDREEGSSASIFICPGLIWPQSIHRMYMNIWARNRLQPQHHMLGCTWLHPKNRLTCSRKT